MSSVMGNDAWEKFYEENPPPTDIHDIEQQIRDFCSYHQANNSDVVLVTSGGTIVPLEHNTVRFVDNFSAGTRGSASAEYFLKAGYAVIFLYRTKSLEPFSRNISPLELMESMKPHLKPDGEMCIQVEGDSCKYLLTVLGDYQEVLKNKKLLKIQFTTLSSYLHILYTAACTLDAMKEKAVLYLAAAVSDFYIPSSDIPTHKIPSNETLNLHLQLVPKILQPLVCHWVPGAFVVSFKLETKDEVLIRNARRALEQYGHKLVIANELNTRKRRVILVTKDEEKTLLISDEEMQSGKEIEEKIVQELLDYHKKFKSAIN